VLAVIGLVLAGLWLALDFPSTEEPPVTVRTATVLTFVPGASTERAEDLVARPTEEAALGLPEVKRVKTTVRPGFVFSYVELHPTVQPAQLPDVWQRLRSRMDDLRPTLPAGTVGPLVDDEFGRVAVLTMGLSGPGYTAGEIREQARRLRDELLRLPGVERVSLHGVREEQVQIVLDAAALAARGIAPDAVARAVAGRNATASAGFVSLGGSDIALHVSGDTRHPSELRSTPVALPGGGSVPLGQLARVERVTQDPPLAGAFVDGQPAAVVAVSMDPGLNVVSYCRPPAGRGATPGRHAARRHGAGAHHRPGADRDPAAHAGGQVSSRPPSSSWAWWCCSWACAPASSWARSCRPRCWARWR
jgi:multidrug efflux pump